MYEPALYEALSRLLAGDLDPAAEAALRGRIAADPALARAWADLSALPDLLGALSLGAPPPALAARLAEQTATHAFDPDDEPLVDHRLDADGLDADRLDADRLDHDWLGSADDTLDPEVAYVRGRLPPARRRALARAPTSAQGREAFLDRLLAEARTPPFSPGTTPGTPPITRSRPTSAAAPHRRFGVTAVIAAVALAAGVVLGLQAPAAFPSTAPTATPAEIALSEGTTLVDGAAHLRAGDLRVRVDGRAHVTVEPHAATASRNAGDTGLVVVGGAASVVPGSGYPEASTSSSDLRIAAGPDGWRAADPDGSPLRFDASGAPVASAASTQDARAPALRVTVEVERGAAVVDRDGVAVAMAAGESRAFEAHPVEVPRVRQVAGAPSTGSPGTGAPIAGTASVPAPSIADEQKTVTRRTVTLSGGLARGEDDAHLDLEPDLGAEEQMYAAVAAVPGAELLDVDCTSRPCVAIFDYVGDDAAWRDALGDALAAETDGGVVLDGKDLQVEGSRVGVAVVSLDGRKARGVHAADDRDGDHERRVRGALADIERELIE